MMDIETKLKIARQWSEEFKIISIEGENWHRIIINYPSKSMKRYGGLNPINNPCVLCIIMISYEMHINFMREL